MKGSSPAWALSAFFVILGVLSPLPAATVIPSGTKQLVVVTSSGSSSQARVLLFERTGNGWKKATEAFTAVVGKNGMAWGGGLLDASWQGTLPEKREGDLRAPAGLFHLGAIMGYADSLPFPSKWEYRSILRSHQGVDDIHSKYYNRIVDIEGMDPSKVDWKSFEVMRRKDHLYKWLVVIGHNEKNEPGKGSMTFLHVWRSKGKGTAGCTALAEEDLLKVLGWLDPSKLPLLLQLLEPAYQDFAEKEGLPLLGTMNEGP